MESPRTRVRLLLRAAPLFAELPPDRVDVLADAAVARCVPAGRVVWRAGSRPDEVMLVLAGSLDVVHSDAMRRVLLRTLFPGDVVGLSTIAGVANSADLVAGPALECATIRGPDFRALLRKDSALALRVIAHLGQLVARLSTERERSMLDDLDTRVRRWVEERARRGRFIRCTHQHVADHIGASRPRVSEALKRLERAGVIRCLRGAVNFVADFEASTLA